MFNLWYHPWIDVVNYKGFVEKHSIASILESAHNLVAITAPSPLSVTGIQRLLIAILQHIYDPQTTDAVAELLSRGHFDSARIASFGATYQHRFALFDTETPFMQLPGPRDGVPKTEHKPVASIFFEVPSGTNRAWVMHLDEEAYAVCPACAAVGMLAHSPHATMYGRGFRASINGAGALYLLPAGASLFITLGFSLLPPEFQPPEAAGSTSPWTWAADSLGNSHPRTVSYLTSLVFPSRSFTLLPRHAAGLCARCGERHELLIRNVVLKGGWYYQRPWTDPFLAYITPSKQQKQPFPMRTPTHTPVWPEIAAALFGGSPGIRRPAVIDHLNQLVQLGALPAGTPLSVRCIGLAVLRQASYATWVDDSLQFPTTLLSDPSARATVTEAVEAAQRAVGSMTRILSSSAVVDRIGGLQAVLTAARQVWGELRPVFQKLLNTAPDGDAVEAVEGWSAAVKTTVGRTQTAALSRLAGGEGHILRARLLRGGLRRGGPRASTSKEQQLMEETFAGPAPAQKAPYRQDVQARFLARLGKLRAEDRGALLQNVGRRLWDAKGVSLTLARLLAGPESREEWTWRAREDYFLIAMLSTQATHQTSVGNLGASLKRLRRQVLQGGARSELYDEVLALLLGTDREGLNAQLTVQIQRLSTANIPVDFGQLLRDVLFWTAEGETVQRRWAEAYYS